MPSSGRRRNRGGGPEAFVQVFGRLLSDRGWEERFRQGRIWEVWEEAVGERIACHAWPERVQGRDTLVVAVSDSIWMQELSFLKAEILARLNACGGQTPMVSNLRFVLGDVDALRAGWKRKGTGKEGLPDVCPSARRRIEAEAEAQTADIRDPEIREAFRRFYVMHEVRKASSKGGSHADG
ncbi:MAG: DUF721 domain-containing protein [Deltaproteobacteria bacterium]